jgi:hypothetical protein
MATRARPWSQRIPAIRQAIRDVIAREGAGLAQLEVEAARDGALAAKAASAVRSTERDLAALRDGLELLNYIEAGGS